VYIGKHGVLLGFPGFFNWFLALESPTSFQFQVFRETFPRILFLKLHQISETEFSGNSTRAGSKRETSKSVSHVKKCLKHHEVSSFSFTNDKNSLTEFINPATGHWPPNSEKSLF